MISLGLLVIGIACFAVLGRFVFDHRYGWGRRALLLVVLFPPAAGATAAAAMRLAAQTSGAPKATRETLFRGIEYERRVDEDAKQVVHVARIELDATGLSFLVSPGEASKLLPMTATRVTDFADYHALELAIVGPGFTPGYDVDPFAPPPQAGARQRPLGKTVSRTVVLAPGDGPATLYLSDRNEASIGAPQGNVYNALTGDCVLLGANANPAACPAADQRLARSAAALDASRRVLWLVVVDGHRPQVRAGMTATELASWLGGLGAEQAVHLGAGPYAELVARDNYGQIKSLSSPMGLGLADTERPAAVLLGVHAQSRSAP